jgi:hypothetical protein
MMCVSDEMVVMVVECCQPACQELPSSSLSLDVLPL